MEPPISSWVFRFILTLFIFFQPSSSSSSSSSSSLSSLHPLIINSTIEFKNYTAISEFRVLNRRVLDQCPDPNPYLQINVSSNSDLSDEEYVTVTVSGVLVPSNSDWVAMISPSNSDVTFYSGQNEMELKVGEAELPWGKRVVLNRSNTVFIDNLPQGIRKAWLFNLFSRFGKIQNIYVPNKKSQKTGNKFGFVRYCNPFYAQKAVEAINGSWIWGEILVANIARFERKNKSKSMQDGNYNIKGKSVEDGQDMSSNGKEQNLSGIWRHKNSPKRSRAQNRLRKGIYVWRKKEIMDQKLGNFSIPVQVKEQGNGWLYRSATAKMDSTRSIVRIQDQLRNLGHAHIQVRHMGGNMVVLTFKDQEERDTMFNKGKMGWLKEWFVESTKGENTKSNPCTRLVWLNCYGVPLHLWNYQNFLEIGRIWGEAIMVADETIKNLSFAVGKILISTSTMESINKTVELDNNGNLVQIRVIEEQFVVNTFLRTDCSCPGCQVEASSMQTLEDSNVQPSTQEENGGEVQPLEDSNVQPSTQEESEGEVKSKGHQIEEAIDSSSPLVEPAPSILGSYPGAIAAPLCPVNITSKQLVPFIESNSSHQITRGSREAESSIPCLKDPASSYLEALTRNLKLPKQNISP